MHVDWNWIKQRPHFLYEELTNFYSVDLFYIHKLYDKNRGEISNFRYTQGHSQINTFKKIPLSGRFRGLQFFEKMLNYRLIKLLQQYDYIWITSPIILDFVSLELLKDKVVIYDCMDDFLGFYTGSKNFDRLKQLEIDLVKRADILFSSSEYLNGIIISRYKDFLKTSPNVINNGVSRDLLVHDGPTENLRTTKFATLNLIYIGTIGDWIDFDLILKVLYQIPEVVFTMIGPIDTKVPSHSRLNFIGAVDHDKIKNYAATATALVMPFKLNELVKSVDPVKIYEYIHFQKPIFAINYDEMVKFLPFVNLYTNVNDFINLILKLKDGTMETYSKKEAEEFLNRSTWDLRCKKIVEILEGV